MAELSALIPSWVFAYPTIDSLGDALDSGAMTAGEILAELLTVDGTGSLLDADFLDGQSGAFYLAASTYTAADVLTKLLTVDGTSSGLDADLLDGLNTASAATVSTVMTRGSAGESALVYLTLSGGVQTTSLPMIVATQTWNASGVSFMGATFDYTITAASSTSRVLRIRGGASATTTLIDVDKNGAQTLASTLTLGNAGTAVGKANSNLGVHTAIADNSTTAETDIMTKTIGAGQVVTSGDRIRATIYINNVTDNDGNTNTIKVYFGGTNRKTLPTVNTTGVVVLRVLMVYGGSSTWKMYIEANGCGLNNAYEVSGISSVNPTGAITFKVTGQSSNADNPPDIGGLNAFFELMPA